MCPFNNSLCLAHVRTAPVTWGRLEDSVSLAEWAGFAGSQGRGGPVPMLAGLVSHEA